MTDTHAPDQEQPRYTLAEWQALARQQATQPVFAPASAWQGRLDHVYERQISNRWWVKLRKLSLIEELVYETLPNPLIRVMFDPDGPTDREERTSHYYAERYQAYLAVAARALEYPILELDPEAKHPDTDVPIVGPDAFNYLELQNIFYFALQEVVPDPASAPFQDEHSGRSETAGLPGQSGSPLPTSAERPAEASDEYAGRDLLGVGA